MATYTEKLGLKLPSQTDFYNVDDFNENFRKLDQNTAQSGDIQQVLTLADPIRSNRAPTTADAQYAGKLWVVPKMIFNNMMPDALAQVASNWKCTASTSSASGSSATIVGDGTASTIVSEVDMTAVRANDIVYINAKMAVTADANGAIIELLCGDDVIATTSMSIPTAGDSTQLVAYTKVDEAGALKLRVTTMYNSASAQLGKGVTISDITILDLTADMCQNFAGIEFTKDETTAYINTYGRFQTKTYELSEYWWICRGSYGGQYSWQRYDDYTNAKVKEYSDSYQNSKATTAEAQAGTNDTHWMTPLKSQQFLTNKLATQAEAQAGSDNAKVMTPLRVANQITAKIATTTEAQAGSVDTKIMTPLKAQQFLTNRAATDAEITAGTVTNKWTNPKQVNAASKTVLDLSTNKLVNINTGFEHFDTWRWTQAEGYIGSYNNNSYNNGGQIHMFRWGDSKVLFVGYYGANNAYYCRYRLMNISTKAAIASWQYTINSDYSQSCMLSNIMAVSPDGSLVSGFAGSSTYCMIDMSNNKYTTFNSSRAQAIYKTSSKWGYIYTDGYNNRRLYYAAIGDTAMTTNYYSLGNGANSSYYTIRPIGVYGSVLWFVEQNDNTEWKLSKIDTSNGSLTTGVATFNVSGNTYMYLDPITHDGSKAYIRIRANLSDFQKYSTYCIVVNMADGSTNWSTAGATNKFVTDVNNMYDYTSYTYYVGSNSTSHFCVYQQGVTEINRSTGAITLHQYGNSLNTYGDRCMSGGKMVTFNLAGYSELIPYGQYVLNTKTKRSLAIYGNKTAIMSYNYVYGGWYGYDYPSYVSCGFGGNVTTSEVMGVVGSSGSQMSIIGGQMYAGVTHIINA